jgi:hypothetical protein
MTNGTHTFRKTLAAGAAALLVAGGGAGAAAACHGHGSDSSNASFMSFKHGGDDHAGLAFGLTHRSGAVASAVVLYLNLPASTIKTDLMNGQSLAQIATAEGKDPNGLVSAIVNAVKPMFDAAVVNGDITSTQESTLLSDLTTKVTAAVNFQFKAMQPQVEHALKHAFFHHHH